MRQTARICTLLALSTAGMAHAAPVETWYVGTSFGSAMHIKNTDVQSFREESTSGGMESPFPAIEIPIPGMEDIIPDMGAIGEETTPAAMEHAVVRYKKGMAAGIVAGYQFTPLLRGEFEYREQWAEIESYGDFKVVGDTKSKVALLNAWFDFNRGGYIRPYFGVGVGRAIVELNHDSVSILVGQLGFGLNLHVADNVSIDLGYRMFDSEDTDFTTDEGADYDLAYKGGLPLVTLKYKFTTE